MKKLTLVLFICLGVLANSFSQTTKKQELIKELFTVMQSDSANDKVMNSILPALMNQNQSQPKDSASVEKAKQVMSVVMETVKGLIEKVNADKVELYDKYFTEKEIKQMIAFYKSPAGKKYVETKPEITKEIVAKIMKDYLPEFKKSIEQKMKQASEKQ